MLYEGAGGTCTVEVFAMRVTEESDWWPEVDVRTREWMPSKEAASRADEEGLKAMIANLPERV